MAPIIHFFHRFHLVYSLLPVLIFSSCGEKPKQDSATVIDAKKLKQQIEAVQQPIIQLEKDEIKTYLHTHQLQLTQTGSGLFYGISKPNPKGKKINTLNQVTVHYKVKLLNDVLCYDSEKKGPKTFLVDNDPIETGIHEAIKYFKEGEKGTVILPSHLAHGVTGDGNRIPSSAVVVYEIEVVSVK